MMCLYEPEVNHNALHLFAIPCVGYTVYKVSEKGLQGQLWKIYDIINSQEQF